MDKLLELLNDSDEGVQDTQLVLGEIKMHLLQSAQESKDASKKILASKKFFKNSNSDLAIDILHMCMANLTINEEPDLFDIVEMVIKHPNGKVKTVAVRFVEKNLLQSPALHNVGTALLFIECLQSNETSVGVPSIKILIDLLSMSNYLDDAAVRSRLLSALEIGDETIALRVYSVAVAIARKNALMLDKVEFLLEKSLVEIEKQDILLLITKLEVLKDIVGYQYMSEGIDI